uniref:Neuronal cell adhesion molecule n=1 Tax=Cyclopterus lumpus TaxID=8103 RepID=A0A8C2WL19_CYCLU
THQSPKDYIIDPRENIIIHCEAKGKPPPSFSWTRNGTHFDIDEDPNVTLKPHSGTLVVDISRAKAEHYECVYQCTARNKHGTAVSNNIVFGIIPLTLPFKALVVQEGVSLVLPCRPPAGLPPPIIFWMDNNFRRLPQSSRVSQSLNGDLYFSNVLREDSRNDYICYARFPYTQTIQQKQPITVRVLNQEPADERKPTFLIPSGPTSSKMVLRGQVLEMECIAEGLLTPDVSWTKVSGDLPAKRTSFLHYQKTLRIVDASESDAGDYRCTARNRLGSVHHTIHVTVKGASVMECAVSHRVVRSPCGRHRTIPLSVSSSSLHLLMDLYAQSADTSQQSLPGHQKPPGLAGLRFLRCCVLLQKAHGGPPLRLRFKDSRSSTLDGDPYILHDNGTLEIHVAQARNSGKYTCVARNILGINENHIYLEVKDPTRILKQPEYKVVQMGRSVVFECKVKHDPSLIPTMTWLKDDGELPDDERSERLIVDSDSLTITDVTENDAGVYTCVMNTTLDHDSASAELTVVERPDPPTDLELTDQKKRGVQLTWIPGDEHNSPIQKFLIQYQDSLHHRGHWHNLTEVPGTRTTAHLKLSPHVHYTFRVLALNAVDFSRPSFPSRGFKTEPAAPDENPTGVQGFGTEHDNLVISWKPLSGLQSNGPGLHYRVMWRQKVVDSDWTTVTVANNSKFVVSGTPTFVPYELKVQAVNDYGAGPEPAVAHGYSGEDLPVAAPDHVQVMLINSTLAEVHWDPVPSKLIRGHLKGYKVYYWRKHSLHKHNPDLVENQILTFSGNHTHRKLPGLHPFSVYSLNVRVYNGKGEGPPSPDLQFNTPEGVPGAPTSLVVTNPNLDSLTLEWSPPHDRNGRITGYTLKYQPVVNNSNELGPVEELALPANETSVTLPNLKYSTRYKFYLNAKTVRGAGVAISQEAVTVIDEGNRQVDIATQGWFIGLMCAIALLILILLIICFIQRNKGGKYPVKEKEDAHTDPEFQPMKDEDCTFGEYSDNEDHKPLKGSRTPSNGTVKRDDSDDSLVDYGEGGDGQFNEDGSFIGQYSGKSASRETAEGHESSEAPSPINTMNSLNSFV